jgi:hypothetical protein
MIGCDVDEEEKDIEEEEKDIEEEERKMITLLFLKNNNSYLTNSSIC